MIKRREAFLPIASARDWSAAPPAGCGEGWLARIALSHWPAEATALVQGEAVAAAMERIAWLHGLEDSP